MDDSGAVTNAEKNGAKEPDYGNADDTIHASAEESGKVNHLKMYLKNVYFQISNVQPQEVYLGF